jgi:hypothetical protein
MWDRIRVYRYPPEMTFSGMFKLKEVKSYGKI